MALAAPAPPLPSRGAPRPPRWNAGALVALLLLLSTAASSARAAPTALGAATPAAALADLLRDPEDRAVPMIFRDGALFIGHIEGAQVLATDPAPADVRASSAASSAAVRASAAVTPAVRAALADIAWPSAPPVAARARLHLADADRTLVVARAAAAPLVLFVPGGAILAADLASPANAALRRWGYLPYLLHVAAAHAAGRSPERFADWPHAPLPHRRALAAWLILCLTTGSLFAAAFAWARRRARPDAHLALFARLAAPASAAWSRPGIARPLGGFFLFISATLLAMGPYLYLTAVVIPAHVQPFPDADGSWAPIEDSTVFAWTLLDVGMSVAFVKRFAEWRVAQPARALAAVQAFVWWQLAAGLLLVLGGGAIALGLLPHTRYALLARVVLLRVLLLQSPGVLSFFTLFFQAIQRFDLQALLDLLEKRLLYVLLPIPFVLLFRAWGRAHPDVGEAFGALVGIAAGQYSALLLTALCGYALLRHLQLPLGPLVQAGFDRATVLDMLRFGLGVVAGKAPLYISNTLEFTFISYLLPGYLTWIGINNLIMTRLVFTVQFVWPFIDSAVPALSESLAARKPALTRYYVIRYLQFGQLFAALVVAVLLGAGRPLVLHALSAEWRPVATYLPLACASALLLPSTWLADAFLRAAGRAGLGALILVGEQLLRVLLFALFIPRLGYGGALVAILVALVLKTAVAWQAARRRVLALERWPWTTTLAPLGAGALVYALLALAGALLPPLPAATVALFVVGALTAFPLGFFCLGLLGALDAAAVDELAHAAELASAMRPLARLLARAGALGARIHPRPRPALAAQAQQEADEIAALERPL